ncbi:Tex-like N-terminal domain-containing protein [Bacillus suaedaesalsae]|uniref:RNA-binding transcriptional accessory protein n=1 Tax=Bacillus suaedaesalsae TaxID=2810349 RepID=A0ABS2DGT9_9BACI|nr:RNA-binding transcriptional accessory protein [Bacillus suaedaesalsae]
MEATAEKRTTIIKTISAQLNIKQKQVQNVIELLEQDNTVPFIARYRKEMTGALDEVEIRNIMDGWQYLHNLEKRKEEVIRLIDEQGKLTDELKISIEKAEKLQTIEDLYRPYKQKRRTKATVAKEKGLEPLALWILELSNGNVVEEANKYVKDDVASPEEALQGAQDIIAEMISDEPTYRQWIRQQTFQKGKIVTKVKDEEKDEKHIYEMYYTYEEPIQKAAPHRVLAMNRGEKEEILKVAIEAPSDVFTKYMIDKVIGRKHSSSNEYVIAAIEDGYKRLIQPSIEREIRNELTEKAEDRAIHIFSENLRNLLLQPPLKGKTVLGVDPAYRTGCKLAVVDETGKVLHIDVIYPHPPVAKVKEATEKFLKILDQFKIEMIAVGNGTASRETEQFVSGLIKDSKKDIYYLIVNEAGASVYSASDIAREEFPNFQVEERSAVSIARRLQDPLAELVKIDPKSVGVGQYQHDVTQKKLNDSLTFVVETAVNQVGVNVNTASSSLLQYVSGLSKAVANNIVKKREEDGKFTDRKELKKIPRLGAKTYEQCIGFLRIPDGNNPLDRTSIHPENYKVVEQLLKKVNSTTADLGTLELKEKLEALNIEEMAQYLEVGSLTLKDILESLARPGRDPRDELPQPILKKDVLKLEDLAQGMELQGTVRNVVDFGAFVDIGVKQDGLVHISKLSKTFVKHPLDIVSVGDVVTVWVDDIDMKKGRVALTMLAPELQTQS